MTKVTKKRVKRKAPPRLNHINEKHATAASTIIDAHYANLSIRKRWTSERINRLCAFLRITIPELGSLLGVKHGWWVDHVKSTKPLSGPICILLTIMENHFMAGYTKDVVSNLFDFNGKQKNT